MASTTIKIGKSFISLSNPDLNNIKYNFRGYVANSTNYPAGQNRNGILDSIMSNNTAGVLSHGMQFYKPYITDKLFFRGYNTNTSTWSEWKEVVTEYTAGETVTLSGAYPFVAGRLNSTTEIEFGIPIGKPVADGVTVSFTALYITVANSDGTIIVPNNTNVIGNSSYTVTIRTYNNIGMVDVRITGTFSGTANTPITINLRPNTVIKFA